MTVALDTKTRYFGTHLSDHIAETPEGFLICRDAVIGRSGFQTYFVSELTDPEGLLDGYDPTEELEVWRDPSEVFSDITLSSFNGKSFTVTHPDDLLTPETDRDHSVGHAQNVRKGSERLDDGNLPMLADIIVKDADAIDRIKNRKERELSCGYTYQLFKNGERFEQRNIIGNHIALVPKGRAGADARINDSAPNKETNYMANKDSILKRIMALGWKAFAAEAKPEEVSAAFDEMGSGGTVERPAAKSGPVFRSIGKTKDGVEVFRSFASDAEAEAEEKKAEEKAGKDAEAEKEKAAKDAAAEEEKKKKEAEGKDGAMSDAEAAELGSRMHAAVDKLMGLKGMKDVASGQDTDIEELKTFLGRFFTEEENEKEHAAKGDAAGEGISEDNAIAPISMSDAEKQEAEKKEAEEKAAKDAEAEAEKKAKEAEGKDANANGGSDIVRPEPIIPPSDRQISQFDTAALKALKPMIAKSGDKKLISAFDTIIRSRNAVLQKATTPAGSYDLFTNASHRSVAGDVLGKSESPAEKAARETNEIYRKRLKPVKK